MKRIINAMFIVLAITAMHSCKEDQAAKIAAKSITIDQTEVSIVEGTTKQLNASILPEDATNKIITWSSANPQTAEVNSEGLVTAIKSGEVQITATTANKLTAVSTITVTAKFIHVTSISLANTETSLEVGKTLQINSKILPSDATDKTIIYTTSDATIASVDANGMIKALKVGEVKVTATTKDGNKKASLTLKTTGISVGSVKIKSYSHEIKIRSFHRLKAIIEPTDAQNKNFTWTSSNPEIATIDNTGEIETVSVGTTTMTVTTEDGEKTASWEINVISTTPMLYHLYEQKNIKDDSKPSGSWTYQKIKFTGSEASIDMDYSFSYHYKNVQATLKLAYRETASSSIKEHQTELFFTADGFNMLTPLTINGKTLSHFTYDANKDSFVITSEGLAGELDTRISGIPVYSYSDCIYKHRLKSGDLQKNYSEKMWACNEKALELLGITRDDVTEYKFELYTYITPVAYEGQDNMFTVTYYKLGTGGGTRWHSFQISGYEQAEDGSIIFKKDSDENKWYDHDNEGCKKIIADETMQELLGAIFSEKGWKVIEEWEEAQYVLISNENPELWFRVWVHYDEDEW